MLLSNTVLKLYIIYCIIIVYLGLLSVSFRLVISFIQIIQLKLPGDHIYERERVMGFIMDLYLNMWLFRSFFRAHVVHSTIFAWQLY